MIKSKTVYRIKKFKLLPSTNRFVLDNIEQLSDKDIIIAEKQSAGKGRLNRQWKSDIPGNIYLTICLKPISQNPSQLPLVNLTQYLSVIICRLLREQYQIAAVIKWPNDILIEKKKLAGILSETAYNGNNFRGLALGLGLNLNQSVADLNSINQPAAALNLLIGKSIDPYQITEQLLNLFFEQYDAFLKWGFSLIQQEYIDYSIYLKQQISIHQYEKKITGIATHIEADGTLLMIDNDNIEHKINIGDMEW